MVGVQTHQESIFGITAVIASCSVCAYHRFQRRRSVGRQYITHTGQSEIIVMIAKMDSPSNNTLVIQIKF